MALKETVLNSFYIFICLLLIVCPIVISIVFNIKIAQESIYFTFSVYGAYIIFYTLIQMFFSYLNKRKVEKHVLYNPVVSGKYNIVIVGYREDPVLFENCLTSIRNLECAHHIHKIFIVIDGNDEDDFYMADLAHNILQATIIRYTTLLSENFDQIKYIDFDAKVYCFLQPHKGKRHALYTGLKISCKQEMIDGVLCSDSDTELDRKSFYYLANLLESNNNYGAVTGYVEIENADASIISFLSSLRYWFACNLERAYQSFNGCVLCVSGPLGIYKTECLKVFLEDWLNQKFMSRECTYGDDRHLSNNILLLGKKIGYTHLSKCYTDAPETIKRFFNQQTRWCKSSLREFFWNIKCLHKHSLWMTIDLLYQTLYSFIVLGSLVYIVLFGNIFQIVFYLVTLVFFNLLKGVYACVISKTAKYLLFTLYGFVYISMLVPAKIYATFTMKDLSWGTSSRLKVLNGFEFKHVFLIFWNIVLVSGLMFNLFTNFPYTLYEIISLAIIASYLLILFIVLVFARFLD